MSTLQSFGDFHVHVTDFTEPNSGSWSVSSSAPKEENKVGFSTNASTEEGISASFSYVCPKDKAYTGKLSVSSDGSITPSVSYEKGPHSAAVNYKDITVDYGYKIDCMKGNVSTKLLDGLASNASFSCVLAPEYQVGAQLDYDAFRSGLKSFSIGALAYKPTWMPKAVFSTSVTNPNVFSFAMSYAANKHCTGLLNMNSTGCQLGGTYTVPDKGQFGLVLSPCEKKFLVSLKKKIDAVWSVTFATAIQCSGKPTFGLTFFHE